MDTITTITLCNVKITPQHQLDFKDKLTQSAYFNSKAVHTYSNCRYIASSDTINIRGYVDNLLDINYGYYENTYKNTSKRFYFWVLSMQYVNKDTTQLKIQLDVFQTWLFEAEQHQCMIEREHVNDDTLGKHTLPESFELGPYVSPVYQTCTDLTQDMYFVLALTNSDDNEIGSYFGKTYSGFKLKFYSNNSRDALTSYIQKLCEEGKGDSIAFIFQYPKQFLDKASNTTWDGNTSNGYSGTVSGDISFTWQRLFTFNGDNYTPLNNKMLTYPFNFITITAPEGGNVILKFENFSDIENITFKLESVLTLNPTFSLTPRNYCGRYFSYEDSIEMSPFGLCSWNNDNYANWYAQHANSIHQSTSASNNIAVANETVYHNNYNTQLQNAKDQYTQNNISNIANTVSSVASLSIGGIVSGVANGTANLLNNKISKSINERNANNYLANSQLLNITNYNNSIRASIAQIQDQKVIPNTCKGDTSSSGLDVARDNSTFRIQQTMIKPEYAKIIDLYFQMFGYKVNRIGKPLLDTRERWNYIKTVNMTISGIPNEDARQLEEIYNNGITIWHDDVVMYQYYLENPIKGIEV